MPAERATTSATRGGPPSRVKSGHSGWPRIERGLVIGFFVLVVVLLVHQARSVDWAGAWVSLRTYPLRTLLGAAALALASYALYCSYDLFGRHLTGHGLPVTRVVGVGFVSYAFNLNLGALVGGVAMRYRLYAGLGLAAAETTKVVMMSVVTNWLGYLLLAGVLFTLRPLELPPGWKLGSGGLRGLGAALCLLVAGYLILCFNAKRRMWTLHGRAFELPTGRIALAQLALSSLNWLTIACIVYLLFDGRIDYPSVLGVMLVAAVAGVISHIPAGLGVLEAVFLTLLAHRAAHGELLAMLLAYRAIYYLAPLALATALFLWFGGRRGNGGPRRRQPDPPHGTAKVTRAVAEGPGHWPGSSRPST